MSDTHSPSDTPQDQRTLMEEKRAQWDAITKKREEMIAAEKAKASERKAEEGEHLQQAQSAYQAEVHATEQRSEEREEWRQEQHEKRAEEELARKEAQAEKERLAEEQKEKDAAEAERKEYLMNLHKVAVAHKIRDRREAVENEADREKKVAGDIADKALHVLDEDTQRALRHLESERQRRITQTRTEDERQRKQIDERARMAVLDAHADWKKADDSARRTIDRTQANEDMSKARLEESQQKMRIESDRKRDLLALDESTSQKLFTIEQESKHLKDEILKNAETKKMLVERQEGRKVEEADRRKENFEKWLKED